jgi:hypothetical protein
MKKLIINQLMVMVRFDQKGCGSIVDRFVDRNLTVVKRPLPVPHPLFITLSTIRPTALIGCHRNTTTLAEPPLFRECVASRYLMMGFRNQHPSTESQLLLVSTGGGEGEGGEPNDSLVLSIEAYQRRCSVRRSWGRDIVTELT